MGRMERNGQPAVPPSYQPQQPEPVPHTGGFHPSEAAQHDRR
jgi:hypothetical protein